MSAKPVFISYSRKDTDFVNRFIERLRGAGVNLWIDKNIKLGGRWDNSIETALESCNDILIMASKNSMESNNVMDEVAYALEENKRVIPIRIEDCEMNFRLRRIQHLDYFEDEDKAFDRLLNALNVEHSAPKQSFKKTDQAKVTDVPKETPKKKNRTLIYVAVVLAMTAVIYFGGDLFPNGGPETNNNNVIDDQSEEPQMIIETPQDSTQITEVEVPLSDQEDWDSILDDAEKTVYEKHVENYENCSHKSLAEEIIKELNELEYEINTWKRAEDANDDNLILNYIEDFGKEAVYYSDAIELLKTIYDNSGYVQFSESTGKAYFEVFEEQIGAIPKENDLIYGLSQRNVRGGKMGTAAYENVVYTTMKDEAYVVLEVELRGSAYWIKIAY